MKIKYWATDFYIKESINIYYTPAISNVLFQCVSESNHLFYVSVCAYECGCSWRQEEGRGSHGDWVTGGC